MGADIVEVHFATLPRRDVRRDGKAQRFGGGGGMLRRLLAGAQRIEEGMAAKPEAFCLVRR